MNKIMIEINATSTDLRQVANTLTIMANSIETQTGIIDNSDEIEKDLLDDDQTTTPSPDQTVTGVELDSEGLPWDARIHGASKAKLAKTQAWKKKRGIDDSVVETVETELRAALAAPAATTEQVQEQTTKIAPPPEQTTKIAPPPESVKSETLYQTANGNFSKADLVAARWDTEMIHKLPIAPSNTVTTFPELMTLITPALASNEISESDILAACNAVGLTSLPLLAARPDLIQQVKDALF